MPLQPWVSYGYQGLHKFGPRGYHSGHCHRRKGMFTRHTMNRFYSDSQQSQENNHHNPMTWFLDWDDLKIFTKFPMSKHSFICSPNIFMYFNTLGPMLGTGDIKVKQVCPWPYKRLQSRREERQVECQGSRWHILFILVSSVDTDQ